jgi:hypothetical protein
MGPGLERGLRYLPGLGQHCVHWGSRRLIAFHSNAAQWNTSVGKTAVVA